jgi:sterol desaturase/sphingolipid hydroxylase (fatty acid hydroxylase superfamily)
VLDASFAALIWNQFLDWAAQASWYAIIFVMVLPLEVYFGSPKKAAWGERCGNFAAMLVHFGVGGAVLSLMLATPPGRWLASYPAAPRHPWLQNPYVWALLSVFLVDAAFYVYHRFQHAIPLLWRVHKLHHTDPAMNVTTSQRTHFLERALQYFCLSVPMYWILGKNLHGMAYAAAITTFFLYFGHADIRLDLGILAPIVVGPMYHRIHHSRRPEDQNRNFAQAFPVLDIVGGTYRRPRWEDYPETGVEDCDTAAARWRPLVW